jgi:3'-phosphoadenosine 5'-phosphosulfate sulfotransferase (PAPS reductase)/FAD synthetase
MKYLPKEVLEAQKIFVSHSGGKDSHAMLAQLVRRGLKDKIVIVHADLGEMEWENMKPWIEKNSFGLPVHVVEGEMDFFELARKYKRLPSGMQQFCTDFLKTKPIKAFIHAYMTEHGITKAINATGMRADESKRRADKKSLVLSKGKGTSNMFMSKKYPTHLIHDWLPIFNYTSQEVFEEISLAGQKPHEIYSQGFSRLSCVFCVNGRISEHKQAAKMRPELAKKMAKLERDLGKTIRLKQIKKVKYPKYLDEYIF